MITISRLTGVLIATLLPATQVDACDLHMGGPFGQFHPLAQRHFAQPNSQNISLTHPTQKRIRTGIRTSIDIRYHIPLRYDAVVVNLLSNDGLSIEGPQAVSLDKLNGNHRLSFISLIPGKHEIILDIAGKLDGKPFKTVQKIDVVSG